MPRPPNCRIFIGNLASEKTSKAELKSIFLKYGNIIEEPIIRRSFGFVQYDNEESAQRAIESENGRIIGDMKIDCSLADNREPRYKAQHQERKDKRRQERRDKATPYPTDRKNRPNGPSRHRRNRSRSRERQERRYRGNSLCHVIYSLPTEEELAIRARNELEDHSIPCEIIFAPRSPSIGPLVTEAFHKNVPFLLFVNRGAPHLNDLHIILPVDQAAVFNSMHISHIVNIIKGTGNSSAPPVSHVPYSYSQPLLPPLQANWDNGNVPYREVNYPPLHSYSGNSPPNPWNRNALHYSARLPNEGNPPQSYEMNMNSHLKPSPYTTMHNAIPGVPYPNTSYYSGGVEPEQVGPYAPERINVNTLSPNTQYSRDTYHFNTSAHRSPNDNSALSVDTQQLNNLILLLQSQTQNKSPTENYRVRSTNYRIPDSNHNPPSFDHSYRPSRVPQSNVDPNSKYETTPITNATRTTQDLLAQQMSLQRNARR